MKELTSMIDQMVEAKTFGLEALDGLKTLRDKANAIRSVRSLISEHGLTEEDLK